MATTADFKQRYETGECDHCTRALIEITFSEFEILSEIAEAVPTTTVGAPLGFVMLSPEAVSIIKRLAQRELYA